MSLAHLLQQTFGDRTLYCKEIDAFFRDNAAFIRTFAHNESFEPHWGRAGASSVSYVAQGSFKLYRHAGMGRELFIGFLPRYSTLFFNGSGGMSLGKYFSANGSATVYSTSDRLYLKFLQSASPDLLRRQISEGYLRRNLNDFALYVTTGAGSLDKVIVFLLTAALSYGHAAEDAPERLVLDWPPTNKDIAAYFSIHPNTVSRCMRQLEEDGLIIRNRQRLTIPNEEALEKALTIPL